MVVSLGWGEWAVAAQGTKMEKMYQPIRGDAIGIDPNGPG
jgi:hypothetical protein